VEVFRINVQKVEMLGRIVRENVRQVEIFLGEGNFSEKCLGIFWGNVRISMQDYKSLRVAIMISTTLTHRNGAFDRLYY